MDTEDKLVIEDVVMALAALMHGLTIQVNTDSRNRQGIDETWREFKERAGRLFTAWNAE